MASHFPGPFTLLILLAVSAPLAASAQAAAPSDVQLIARVHGGQTTFRIGEVIPIELSFTSISPRTYQFDNATYDRSGRLNEDQFSIEPKTGWDDPLDIYFRSYQLFFGGGLRSFDWLSDRPEIVHLELNEWVRFKTPGRYRIRITSLRVSRGSSFSAGKRITPTSNEFVLTIVPATKEWQAATLKSAVATLDPVLTAGTTRFSAPDSVEDAVKTLRYLGTADAAREMARHLRGTEWDWEFSFGLIGSPARNQGIAEMNRLLVDPDFPVIGQFLSTMAIMSVADNPSDKLPEERSRAEAQFREMLAATIKGKQGAARAVSANTVLEESADPSTELPPAVKQALTRDLVDDFDKLPVEKQVELLQYRWSALDHQQMLPVLRAVAGRYQDFRAFNEVHASEFNEASAAALKHWYEMAPDEARPAIIEEMLRPKPRFGASVLGILPDKTLPEVESTLVEHLTEKASFDTSRMTASLIERYATPAIEARVTNYLDPVLGKVACDVQNPLLAYLLRVDPELARPRIDSALAARGEGFSACNHGLLLDLASMQNHSMLQEMAIKSLDDPDPEVVETAAAYLGRYGSASAEDILWARFTSWSAQWQGHERELQYFPDQSIETLNQAEVGTNLLQALGEGHGWLADEAKIRRLIDLSVGEQERQEANGLLNQWRTGKHTIIYVPSEHQEGNFHIAQYQETSVALLREKLLQFPPGTSFDWSGSPDEPGEEKAFQEVLKFANENGFGLQKQK